jgi:hypothetical protein
MMTQSLRQLHPCLKGICGIKDENLIVFRLRDINVTSCVPSQTERFMLIKLNPPTLNFNAGVLALQLNIQM